MNIRKVCRVAAIGTASAMLILAPATSAVGKQPPGQLGYEGQPGNQGGGGGGGGNGLNGYEGQPGNQGG